MLRLLHTADWHLGQTLHGIDRSWEHQCFLDWLLDQLEAHAIDVLVVAGDVFDVAHPTSAAQAQYYRFIAEARRRSPRTTLVVVGGNHDSPARLDAPAAILGALGVHVVGGLRPKMSDDDLLIPLPNRSGDVEGWLLAVPFLRPRDLPGTGALLADPTEVGPKALQRLIDGHRGLYARLADAAAPRRRAGEALIATGHCYMAGGSISALSERKIQVGNQHALPADIFPDTLTYVALGHLHRAQTVGPYAHIRYSGSPLPLSLAERDYPHQVLRIDFDGDRIDAITELPVPRVVDILRIPETAAPVDEVLALLEALPRRDEVEGDGERTRPYLEVRVRLDAAQPRLRQDVQAALQNAWPRLLRIDVTRPPASNAESWRPQASLERLSPDQVFEACYLRARERTPSDDLRALFADLVHAVESGEEQ